MEKNDENDDFEKVMDKYNFDSPIKVTLVVEEENPPDPFSLMGLLLSKNTNVPNSNTCPNNSEVYQGFSNVYNARNQLSDAEKNCNRIPIVEQNNHSVSSNQTALPEAPQKNTQDVPWHLLDIVADNLIHITKCYYHNFSNSKNQVGLNHTKLKYEYLTFKHHFFNLSYSTTIAVLLPQEHNKDFLNNFIHRVISIANRNSWYQIKKNELEILIRDMLRWTKQKKKNLDIKLGSHNYERCGMNWSSGAPTTTNRLGPTTNCSIQGTNNRNHKVRKTHLPVQVMNKRLNISPRTNNVMPDVVHLTSNAHMGNNLSHERTNWPNGPETLHSRKEINNSTNVVEKTNHLNQGIANPLNRDLRLSNSMQEIARKPYIDSRINQSTKTITSTYNNEPKTSNINCCRAKNTNQNKILLSTGPPDQVITISIEPQILANINQRNTYQVNSNLTNCQVNKACGTNPMKRRKPNDNYPMSNQNDNNPHYQNNNYSATNFKPQLDGISQDDSRKTEYELFNSDSLRSSISRDSGFGSPAYGSSHNEEMIEPFTTEEQEIPTISHVTSMNPNAVNLINGFCTVCGAITKNICIGCYQKYYCSTLCQNKDWDVHKYLCSS